MCIQTTATQQADIFEACASLQQARLILEKLGKTDPAFLALAQQVVEIEAGVFDLK